MALNASEEAIIAHRRELVARLRLRGASQREIVETLPKLEPPCINNDTGEPWSLGTINSDVKALQTQWGREAAKSIKAHKARQMAEIGEAKRQAWVNNDIQSVLRAINQEMDLLGTEAPKKTEVTGKDGKELNMQTQVLVYLPENQRDAHGTNRDSPATGTAGDGA